METSISYKELFPYFIAINIILGFLFGSFPLIAGLYLKEKKYALFGFIGAIISGAVLGVYLSFPVAAVFLWLIVRRVPLVPAFEKTPSASDTSTKGQDLNG